MKDILFIGGPEKVQGVERINDDVHSILAVDGLYDRKAVVVWPTEDFLKLPDDPAKLADVCNMKLVDLVAIMEKELRLPRQWTSEDYHNLVAEAHKDKKLMADALVISARSQAFALLSKLVLAVSGGQNLVTVLPETTPKSSMRWATFVDWWSKGHGSELKNYTSSDSGYGALNAVGKWPLVYHGPKLGFIEARELVPQDMFMVDGNKVYYDANSYLGAEHALTASAELSFPVTDRLGGARAIKVSTDSGYMLVLPPPDKVRNFVIGLKASKAVPVVEEKKGKVAKVRPSSSIPKAVDDEYVTVKEAAELLKCSDKTIRNYYGDGRLKHKKVGQRKVLILKSSVDALLG